jgi:A/G-specific adenine glycosylase
MLIHWYYKQERSALAWYHQSLCNLALRNHASTNRVAQGTPYFSLQLHFTVFDLAEANEEEVLKLWQGLGYYSRARNLQNNT